MHPSTSVTTPKKKTVRKKDQSPIPGTFISATAGEGSKTYKISEELSDSGTAHFIRDEDKLTIKKQDYQDDADILITCTVSSLSPTTKDDITLKSE